MDDLEILKQLLKGNHLEGKELNRAIVILYGLDIELKRRII